MSLYTAHFTWSSPVKIHPLDNLIKLQLSIIFSNIESAKRREYFLNYFNPLDLTDLTRDHFNNFRGKGSVCRTAPIRLGLILSSIPTKFPDKTLDVRDLRHEIVLLDPPRRQGVQCVGWRVWKVQYVVWSVESVGSGVLSVESMGRSVCSVESMWSVVCSVESIGSAVWRVESIISAVWSVESIDSVVLRVDSVVSAV